MKPRFILRVGALLLTALTLLVVVGCMSREPLQRKFLFFPTHYSVTGGLTPWTKAGKVIGFSRPTPNPKTVWLMFHGNAGQAADRTYALPSFPESDTVFILEYPGYGTREGLPSRASFDAAAVEAYLFLRETFPKTPVAVVGESIGTGPASMLGGQPTPPDKIVLITPFDDLKSVAKDHFPYLPVGLLLGKSWDNASALANYRGPVEIFGADSDGIIKVEHAKNLAEKVPTAKFHLIEGGHNEWSRGSKVRFANP